MTRPEFDPTSAVADCWIDGMSLVDLGEGVRVNRVAPTQQSVDNQRFWSTPERAADSTVREVMQVTLASARRVNSLEFDLAIFPQNLTVEFYDETTRVWSPCLDALADIAQPVTYAVRDAIPAILPPPSTVLGHLHPQHSYTGHWRTVSLPIRPVSMRTLRLILTRTTEGTTPTNPQGQAVPYSLAVRNLNLTYTVTRLSDVPWTQPGVQGEQRDTFASTTDMFGSPVDFSVRVNAASNAIGDTLGANGLTTVWKSEPQPVPWAVVNYYLDARDDEGNGQTLDRIYLDPLYDGPTCNLYWSNSGPTDAYHSGADPLPPEIAVVNNTAGITGNVLDFDDPVLQNLPAFVEIDNRGISYDPSRPWWCGGQLNFKFVHGTQNTDNPIVDCGQWTLTMTPLGPQLSTAGGDAILLTTQTPSLGVGEPPITGGPAPALDGGPTFLGFDPAIPMTYLAWSDGIQIGLAIRFGNTEFQATTSLTVPFISSIPSLRIGAFQGDSPGLPLSKMQAFVLKTDTVPDADTIEDFLTNPLEYILGSGYLDTPTSTTDNALVRYHPSFFTIDFPAAMIGGAPDRYYAMDWSPIARDYVLRKGYLYFPPTRAKYWKLEFTNLSPQPYEVYQPVQQSIQVFPSELWLNTVGSSTPMSSAALAQLAPGQSNSYVVNALVQTLDNGQTAIVGTGAAGSNTTARVLYDTDVRQRVGDVYWAWNFLPLHPTGANPSWQSTGRHVYQVVDVQQRSKIAYFVGLKQIQAYRLNYLSADDTEQYVDSFVDTSNLDPDSNWILAGDHQLTSGGALYAEAVSKVFPSNRIVTAVQFASQQSDPIQLLPDPGFDDPTLADWSAIGDAVISDSSGLDPTLASTKRIDRSEPPMTWARVVAGYGTYGAIHSANTTYGQLRSGTQIPAESGGVSSQEISAPVGGRIHVAARVTASADLAEPLYVQVVDANTEAVLAEDSAVVKAGKIVEWYTSYTLGEGVVTQPWLYRDFFAGYSQINLNDSFAHPNQTTLPAMDSGQPWQWRLDSLGNENSLDIVSTQAKVTNEGQYDFADCGSPWGTLSITVGAMGTTSTGTVCLIRADPFFITEVGAMGLLSGSGIEAARGYVLGAGNTPYAVQPNDVIRIDFMPADYVPVGLQDSGASSTEQYAMVFYVNGVWKATRNHAYGGMTTKGIKGRLNQCFKAFSFTPASPDYGMLPGPGISGMPRLGNGAWIDATTQQTWQTNSGRQWFVASSAGGTGSWDATNAAEFSNRDDVGTTLTATTDGSVIWTDVGSWYGTMSFQLRTIAGTSGQTDPAGRRGYVACLDHDAGIYLDALGNLVQNGTIIQAGFYSGGLPLGKGIQLVFFDAREYSPTATPARQIYAVCERVIKGTAGTAITSLMTGTKRGLAGSVYSGSHGAGADYLYNTSFQSFNWSPSAKLLSSPSSAPTWGTVTHNGTATYGDIANRKPTTSPQVKARCVQRGATSDSWDIDSLVLYADPIVWSFSTDGGFTWYPAYEIRNNPTGVLVFPTTSFAQSIAQQPGTALMWKAISYRPGSIISSLVIRPWYAGLVSGITHRAGLVASSPNVMMFDHYGDIRNDARFKTWSSPIPREWWYAYQILQRSSAIPTAGASPIYPSDTLYPSETLYPEG